MEKKELLSLLASNKIPILFKTLFSILKGKNPKLENQLVLLESRWSAAKKKELAQLEEDRILKIEFNQIKQELITLIHDTYNEDKPKLYRIKRLWPLLILIACTILTIPLFLPSSNTSFSAEIQAPYLSFKLAEDWDLDFDFFMEEFRGESIQEVVTPNFNSFNADKDPLEIYLEGLDIQLAELIMESGTFLSLNLQKNEWQAHTKSKPVYGAFNLENTPRLIRSVYEVRNPETILETGPLSSIENSSIMEFESQPNASFYASLCANCSFQIKRLAIDSIQFIWNKDESPSSSILNGSINILGKNFELKEKDNLILGILTEAFLWINRTDNGLLIKLEGKSSQIKLGFKGKYKDLRPSLLEILLNKANIRWLLAVFLWIVGGLAILFFWRLRAK